MKKTISGLLALFLLLSLCAGCGSKDDASGGNDQNGAADPAAPAREGNIYNNLLGVDPDEAALEANGRSIPMGLYLYWLTSSCSYVESQISMMNMYSGGQYSEIVNEDGSLKWDGELEGTPLTQIAREQAESSALSYLVMESVAEAHQISLTDEDKAAIEEDRAAYAEQLGGQEDFVNNLWEMGITQEDFDRVSAAGYYYQHLLTLAQDPASDLYQAPGENDAYVDHILLMTKDAESGEPLGEEEAAEKKAKAEELLTQLQETDPAELETLFTQLADENGEDEGRNEGKGYLINEATNFVQEFKDAAFALQPGQISGIVESDYGYHILMRKDLTEDHLASLAALGLSNYLDGQLAELAESVKRSEKLDAIDVKDFITSYREAVMALHPELNTENDAQDGEDAGNAGDAGDAGNGEGDAADGGDAPAEE